LQRSMTEMRGSHAIIGHVRNGQGQDIIKHYHQVLPLHRQRSYLGGVLTNPSVRQETSHLSRGWAGHRARDAGCIALQFDRMDTRVRQAWRPPSAICSGRRLHV
jgi:hypothetical protein